MNVKVESENQFLSTNLVVQSLDSVAMEVVGDHETKPEVNQERKFSQDTEHSFSQTNAMISRSSNASRKYHVGPRSMPKKRSKKYSNGRLKTLAPKQVDAKTAALLLPSKEAQEEVLKFEVRISKKLTVLKM